MERELIGIRSNIIALIISGLLAVTFVFFILIPIYDKITNLTTKITAIESSISGINDKLKRLENDNTTAKDELKQVQEILRDLETVFVNSEKF